MVTATSVRAASDRDVVEKRINRELPREERCPAPRRLGGSGIGPGGTARRRHGDPTKNSGPMVAIGPRRFSKLQGLSSQEGLYSGRSEEHTSELQSLMSTSYAVFCLKKKKTTNGKG